MIAAEPQRFVLKLFVSGASELSARSVAHARALCDAHLAGRYELTVVDVNEDHAAAAAHRVIAVPTLIRLSPAPRRRCVGDLGHTGKILAMLTADPPQGAPAGRL